MTITIIGASAGVGLLAVEQALAKGHRVTALSRNVSAIPDHPLLTKLTGDATLVTDLKRAIAGTDAVLITIGTKQKKATTLFSETASALIQATTELAYTAPVLVLTGFGSGSSSRYLSLFMRVVIRLFLRDQYADKTRMEELIANSAMTWELVRPGRLTNGPLTQSYRVITTLDTDTNVSKIARADVTHFMLREAENPAYLRKYPALTQ